MSLEPLDVSAGADLAAAQRAVERALEGLGPVWPTAGDPAPTHHQVRAHDSLPDDLAAVVPTSGSSGAPKQVLLTAACLRASATATHARLGGPGQWLLALPAQHIAGFQVLCRSALAGTAPVAVPADGPFTAARFAAATARLDQRHPRYTALVPTQLSRLLRDPGGVEALGAFDAVLVGGAALPAPVAALVRQHRLPVVTTYGMTETSGGCVYDGQPLPGVSVALDDGGRVRLGGPVVAAGYLGRPDLTAQRFAEHDGLRWFGTEDLGDLEPDGRLAVLGRADDIINTGGHKVSPADVVAALLAVPGVRAAHVEGVEDDEWGQRVATAVVLSAPSGPEDQSRVREAVRRTLPPHAVPRQVLVLDALPLLSSGKPDRVRLRALLAGHDGRM